MCYVVLQCGTNICATFGEHFNIQNGNTASSTNKTPGDISKPDVPPKVMKNKTVTRVQKVSKRAKSHQEEVEVPSPRQEEVAIKFTNHHQEEVPQQEVVQDHNST
jgi:hypothetical protein